MNSTTWHGALGFTLVVGAALGCGGSDSTGPGSSNITCSITLTGAETGSPGCSGITALWTSDENTFVFGFQATSGATVIVSIASPGEPTSTTYHSSDSGEMESVVVQTISGSSSWLTQSADPSNGVDAVGTYTLAISSVSMISSADAGKVYRVHGTLSATLEPVDDAIGTVALNATF